MTAGHAVPAALANYYRDLDAGRMDDAASWFSEDTTYEVVPTPATRGRAPLAARFEGRGHQPFRHDLQLCLVGDDRCLVEGIGRNDGSDEPRSSFVALATFDADGRIDRYLACGCEPVWPDDAPDAVTRTDADVDAAVRGFLSVPRPSMLADDIVFSSTTAAGDRVDLVGRAAVEAAWATCPELAPAEHAVDVLLWQGSRALVDGHHGRRRFIASVGTDGAGSISRFIAFHHDAP